MQMIKIEGVSCAEQKQFLEREIKDYLIRRFHEDVDSKIELRIETNEKALDSYSIQMEGPSGSITSNTFVGLLNGWYRYLEEMGVRFVRPGKDREVFLENVDLNKKMEVELSPAYFHRGVCIEGADSFENLKDFIDWLPKIGMNSFFIQFENPYSF
ncbi:hypothetical protein, partial [Dubosiella newyorkensis]